MRKPDTTDWRAEGAKMARAEAVRQGLPEVVEDVATLRRIAVLAGLTGRAGQGTSRQATQRRGALISPGDDGGDLRQDQPGPDGR